MLSHNAIPLLRSTPDAPFAYRDLSTQYPKQDPSFLPTDIHFFADPDRSEVGVYVVDARTPTSLPVPTSGIYSEKIRIVDSTGAQTTAGPEYLVFAVSLVIWASRLL